MLSTYEQLAFELQEKFERNGDLDALEEAINLYRQALDLTPQSHPHRFVSLNNIAVALSARFKQKGNILDLEELIRFRQQALDLSPFPHPERSSSLSNFAFALFTRFKQTGDLTDLDESIRLHRQALCLKPVPHPFRFGSLSNLAYALSRRFQQKGDLADLDETIECYRQVLELRPVPNPHRSRTINNLATALSSRFRQKGDLTDLEESIRLHSQHLDLLPSHHSHRPTAMDNLANVLSIRFDQKGDIADLEESIRFHRQALELRPAGQYITLNNLANSLNRRFKLKGEFADLEESIGFHRRGLDLHPVHHIDKSGSLNNLASALLTRFKQRGNFSDVEEAIKFHRKALDLRPAPHPDRPTPLINLASALSEQFKQKEDVTDLEAITDLYKEALDLLPISHPDRFTSLSGFALVLSTWFEVKGNLADLEESIRIQRKALELRPVPHPGRPSSLNKLVNALSSRFEQRGDPVDLEECINLYHEAASYRTSSVSQRFRTSMLWANYANSKQHPSALEAYGSAISLLPYLASLDMNLQQLQEALLKAKGLACNAANCAIQNNQMELAVEFLSMGRSVFWTQALHLHTPLDDLPLIHPRLAHRLQSISNTLESASMDDNSHWDSLTSMQRMNLEEQISEYRRLGDEWNEILEEVRQIEGFEDFLCSKPFSKLCLCASNGPVILLNATKLGCDALIVTIDGVKHVPLPNMKYSLAISLGKLVQRSLLQNDRQFDDLSDITTYICVQKKRHRGPYYGKSSENGLQTVLEILWDFVVCPVIKELQLQRSETPNNRIWWCPTGPFVFLPIHAAGVYNHEETECISDYCLTSYSSTLQDLLVSPTPTDSNFKMLAVIQPKISSLPNLSLPGTIEELQRIEDHVPQPHSQYLVKLGGGLSTSVEEVLSHLPSSSIVHFGCHGFQNSIKPLNSGLHLEDGHLKISEIIGCHIPKASLAYLSACETAKGDASAPDEAMHIAATMIFAGFQGVVGTMWSIADEDAPRVADAFYRYLFRHGSNPDCTEAAKALHLAVKELRANDESVTFHRWVPFVHYGV